MEMWVQILIPIHPYPNPKILGENKSTDYKTCKAPDDKNEGSLWNHLEG